MEELRNKFLLLDTNILINSSKFRDDFQPFYDEISRLKTQSVLDHTVKLEFFRGAKTKDQKNSFTSFIATLFGKDYHELKVDNQILETAVKLAMIYNKKNVKVELGDYLIGAQMQRFSGSQTLYLATNDHHDFPRFIFDRVYIHTIDIKRADLIINVGIYKFNTKAYLEMYREFE